MSSESEFSAPHERSAQDRVLPAPGPEPQAIAEPQAQAVPQAQGAPQLQAQGVPQVMIVPKNPALGVILSFFIPGLGSMVNGSVGRGAIILGVYAFGWILAFFLIGIPILFGAWVWGLVDGYLSAQRWNQSHGIVS